MRYFSVCVTFPLCRYVASVNQALLCRLSYEVVQRRSNPEVVGSIPTEVKRFFLYLVWQPRSQGPLLLGPSGRVGEDPGNEVWFPDSLY